MAGRLEELDVPTAMRLLTEHGFGRVALNAPGGPLVFPVNYVYDRGSVVWRSDIGTKLTAAEHRNGASFQVDHVDREHQIGWSVLVRGRLVEVEDPAELERIDELPLVPFAAGQGKAHVVRLEPSSITGRRIPLPDGIGGGWYRSLVEDTSAFDADQEPAQEVRP